MATEASVQALKILRDGSQFDWYVITLLAFVVYVYAVEIEKKNWNRVLAGLAFWGMDWFNEIWNGLVFHFTQHAPVWGTPGNTAYLILIGLNIEICFMFAVAGVVYSKMLPPGKHLKIMGIPNRLFFAVANSFFCVLVEILLNSAGALTWEHSWWNAHCPWLIFLVGYLPFFLVAFWVHDMASRKAQLFTVSGILGFDLVALITCTQLGWI